MNTQRIFMVGWEYPPHNSGGLGVACEGITSALANLNTQIYFSLPYQHPVPVSHMELVNCQVGSQLPGEHTPPFSAYASAPVQLKKSFKTPIELTTLPQSEMELSVNEYAEKIALEGKKRALAYDVIHAHDWMAFPAAIKLHEKTDKPFVAHIHSTEFDRIPGGFGSQYITQTEYVGVQRAQKVIAVSHFTKRVLVEKYNVDPRKISVVHNGITPLTYRPAKPLFAPERPVIVFMGRLTAQKGAEYFLALAEAVLKKLPDALFIVAGNGDQYHSLLLHNASRQLSASLIFTGFLRDSQREALLERADVFVMPSLAEPFGLVALEAAQRDTPVIVSENSGVKEILPSALTADFWDLNKMSDQILQLVKDQTFTFQVTSNQHQELKDATWEDAGRKITDIYKEVL